MELETGKSPMQPFTLGAGELAQVERGLRAIEMMREAVRQLPAGGSALREVLNEFEFWHDIASLAANSSSLKSELTTCRSILGVIVGHLDAIADHLTSLQDQLDAIQNAYKLRVPLMASLGEPLPI